MAGQKAAGAPTKGPASNDNIRKILLGCCTCLLPKALEAEHEHEETEDAEATTGFKSHQEPLPDSYLATTASPCSVGTV